jgi:phosphatidylethanolamine-binding protein (PEBP) family uncharacterized protein
MEITYGDPNTKAGYIVGWRLDVVEKYRVQYPPCLRLLNKQPGELYSIIMWDLDAPLGCNDIRADPKDGNSGFLHWWIANISIGKGDVCEWADEIAKYFSPNPPQGTINHRYMFYLFKQGSKIDMKGISDRERPGYNIRKIVKKYNMEHLDQMGFVVN